MIDYADKELFQQDSLPKNLIVTYDNVTLQNSDIVSESLEVVETLCDEENIVLGSCCASQVTFRIGYIAQSLIGKEITVSIQPQGGEILQIGKYIIDSDRRTADRRYKDIVAYDVLKTILESDVIDWYNAVLPQIDSTVTLKQFRDSFFTHFGVEQESISLINDTMIVEKTVDAERLSGSDVITKICEINACFGHIGRDGKFHYIYLDNLIPTLYPAEDIYPSEDLYPSDGSSITNIGESGTYIGCDYEDYITAEIDKLQIRQSEDDIGKIVGTGTNCYVIQDNFLVYGKTDTELTNIANPIYTQLQKIHYTPATIEVKGNPCFEVGDGVQVITKYDVIATYILKRTLKGIQALRDVYEASGSEYLGTQLNSVNEQITQLKGRTNRLKRTVDETVSELEAYETQTDGTLTSHNSRITQNAESISSEVTRASNAEGTLSSQISQQAGQIALKVSKGDVSSQLSVESGQVSISSNRLIIDSTYFKLYADGTGKLGGLSFDSIGFYSIYNNHKLFQVHPNPSDGYAMSVGLNTIDRLTDSGAITYIKNQYGCCIDSSGAMVITSLKVKDEYDASQYKMTKPGQLLVDSFIRCWGNIECGTTDSRAPLGGVGGGSIYIRRTSTDTQGTSGNLYAANNVYCVTCVQSSDRRLKKDIEELKNSEEFIYALKPVSFRYVDNDRLHHRGFIAQDIEELVEDDSALVIENTEGTKYLGYDELIADMVSTIQSQHKRISDLERRLAILEEKLNG